MARPKNCPKCKSITSVREILWGIPDGDVDEDKYFIGGCLVDENSSKYRCVECGWEDRGFRSSRFILDTLEGISMTCGKCKQEFEASSFSADHACEQAPN